MKTYFLHFLVLAFSWKGIFGEHDMETAISFTKDNFEEKVTSHPHFVMFFAPWCGHCKRLAPIWEELSLMYNEKSEDQEVSIGKVDCTMETSLCSDQDVTGYPTLKFFKEGVNSGTKYRGQRTISHLIQFIEEQMGKKERPESQEEEIENGVYVLKENSFEEQVRSGDCFIKFYAPWCGHCQKLAPTWEELGNLFQKERAVKIAKLDCTQALELCQRHEVRGYPTLAFYRNGEKVETYKGARNLYDLKDFVSSMTDLKKEARNQVSSDESSSKVLKINSQDFEETIKTGITFIKFFAPWCGHCKRLAPAWDLLAAKFEDFEGIKIAKVDCTSDENKNKELCNNQGVNGFPTLNIYKNGDKVAEYTGSRKIEDLVQFVNKHVEVGKDEL